MRRELTDRVSRAASSASEIQSTNRRSRSLIRKCLGRFRIKQQLESVDLEKRQCFFPEFFAKIATKNVSGARVFAAIGHKPSHFRMPAKGFDPDWPVLPDRHDQIRDARKQRFTPIQSATDILLREIGVRIAMGVVDRRDDLPVRPALLLDRQQVGGIDEIGIASRAWESPGIQAMMDVLGIDAFPDANRGSRIDFRPENQPAAFVRILPTGVGFQGRFRSRAQVRVVPSGVVRIINGHVGFKSRRRR